MRGHKWMFYRVTKVIIKVKVYIIRIDLGSSFHDMSRGSKEDYVVGKGSGACIGLSVKLMKEVMMYRKLDNVGNKEFIIIFIVWL